MPNIYLPAAGRQSSPRRTVWLNSRNAISAAIQWGITGGIIFTAFARFILGYRSALAAGCLAALVYALAAAYGAGLWTWTQFKVTHIVLAVHGWLPWRLWSFLEDAHSRGALRQAGTTWQFRHALLQDHLARNTYLRHLGARADAGDENAALRLAQLLVSLGRADELRARADRHAADRLSATLAGHGRVDEALAVLKAQHESGVEVAAERLVNLLYEHGRVDSLQVHADAGDEYAGFLLALLLASQGQVDALQARADADDKSAARQLAKLLVKQRPGR